jgi:hypothetical protein
MWFCDVVSTEPAIERLCGMPSGSLLCQLLLQHGLLLDDGYDTLLEVVEPDSEVLATFGVGVGRVYVFIWIFRLLCLDLRQYRVGGG